MNGAVIHSIGVQAESYYVYLEFLHGKDTVAKMSRTVSQIIEQGLLPEREIKIGSSPSPLIPMDKGSNSGKKGESMESPFGIFGAYALEYPNFQKRAGLNNETYWDWVDLHFQDLGAHWTRSNLQLIWDMVEPEIGKGYRWENQFATDRIVDRISKSPATVNWIGVFHEGGKSADPVRPPLRDPMDYPEEYRRFVKAAVERYDGDGVADIGPSTSVKYWQIGNEYPGWEKKGKTLDQYLAWAKLTSSAIKEADPGARIILIADTQAFTARPWQIKAIEELARDRHIDAVDLHHWGKADDWRMPAVPEVRSLLDRLGRSDAKIFSCEHGTWIGKPDGFLVDRQRNDGCYLLPQRRCSCGNDILFRS